MANFNLTNQQIKDTYEQLAQIGTSSLLLDGTGSIVTNLEITASRAVSASWAPAADTTNFAQKNAENEFTAVQTINSAETNNLILTGSGNNRIIASGDDQDTGIFELKSDANGRIIQSLGAQVIIDARASEILLNKATTIAQHVESPIVTGSWGEVKEDTNYLIIQNKESGIKLRPENGDDKILVENTGVTVDGTLSATSFIGNLDYSLLTGVPSGIVSSSDQITDVNLTTLTASHAEITGDLVVQGTASFAYIESITGSVKRIGDAFIQVNNDTPTQRFGGLKVVDSGSAAATASFMFDGENQDWMYQYDKDATDYAIAIFGPEFSDTNSPSYPSNNVLQKGVGGGHHIGDSSITDDGTTVNISADVSASGFVSASTYHGDGGNLTGIALGLTSGTGNNSMKSGDQLTVNPANAGGSDSIALGDNAQATGNDSIAIGGGTSATANNQIDIAGRFKYDGSDTIQLDSTNFLFNSSGTIGSGRAAINMGIEGGQVTADYSSIFGATYSNATTGNACIVGGYAHTLSGGTNNAIIGGGESCTINGGDYSAIFGGSSNTISAGDTSFIVGGYQNQVTGGARNGVIGGNQAISNHNFSVLIGRQNFTSTAEYTTYVANLDASGSAVISGSITANGQINTPTFAGSVASNTSSIDFDGGNFATLNLTAGTFLANPSNLKSGTTYTIILDSGSLISGHGSAFKFAGGTAPTYSDNTDVLTMVSDGTNLYATALTDFS